MVALISLLTLSQPFTDFFELSEHPSLLTNSLRPIDQTRPGRDGFWASRLANCFVGVSLLIAPTYVHTYISN
ncbi:hypothetical protein H9L39_00439 [Fusarium oxysporum f. sp. albedinis]|nr:hypothetical protein H9L39_00439 [Fusarium oxysporum f. sp. albedinis]